MCHAATQAAHAYSRLQLCLGLAELVEKEYSICKPCRQTGRQCNAYRCMRLVHVEVALLQSLLCSNCKAASTTLIGVSSCMLLQLKSGAKEAC